MRESREEEIEALFDRFFLLMPSTDTKLSRKHRVGADQVAHRLLRAGYTGSVKSVHLWVHKRFEGHETVRFVRPKGRGMWIGITEKSPTTCCESCGRFV